MSFGMTSFLGCMGEGRSGDSTEIKNAEICFESPLLPSPFPPSFPCHPEFFHKTTLNFVTEAYLWKNEGSPRISTIFQGKQMLSLE
jgi:hypothetical protein